MNKPVGFGMDLASVPDRSVYVNYHGAERPPETGTGADSCPTPQVQVIIKSEVRRETALPLGLSVFHDHDRPRRCGRMDRLASRDHVAGGKLEPVRARGNVGRNKPCPCGSGAKLKRCCGR